MGRRASGGGALLAALFALVPAPSSAEPTTPPHVTEPAEGAVVALASKPFEFTVANVPQGTAITVQEVQEAGLSGDLCADRAVAEPDGSWTCGINQTIPAPGAHTFRITAQAAGAEPTWVERRVTVTSALAITTAEITDPATNEVRIAGTRDPGGWFRVYARAQPVEPGGSARRIAARAPAPLPPVDMSCDSSPDAGDTFACTADLPDDLAPGTTVAFTVGEYAANDVGAEFSAGEPEDTTTISIASPPGPPGPPVDPPPPSGPVEPSDATGGGSAAGPAAPDVAGPVAAADPTTPAVPSASPSLSPSPSPSTSTPSDEPSAGPDAVAAPPEASPEPVMPEEGDDGLRGILLLGAGALAILTMLGPRGLAFASDPFRGPRGGGSLGDLITLGKKWRDESATHERRRGEQWGDRSWTWRSPGHRRIDRFSTERPQATSRRYPLIARALTDANYLRAALGSAWLLFSLVGAGLGVWAGVASGGLPVAPSALLVGILIVLAVADSTAGLAAMAAFTVTVVASGGIFADQPGFWDGVRTLLVLAVLWFIVPLVGAAVRPFRRPVEPDRRYWWDRAGDALIAGVVGGLTVYVAAAGLDDVVGRPAEVSDHAGLLGLVTAAAMMVRVGAEEVVRHGYPTRLRAVQNLEPLAEPTRPHQLRGLVVQTGLLVVVVWGLTGNCWQLWAAATLYFVPRLIAIHDDKLPNLVELHRRLPRGILEVFVILVIGLVIIHLVIEGYHGGDALAAIRNGYLLLCIPPFALTVLELLGRNGPRSPWTWQRQLAGAVVVAATIWVVVVFL